jgi:hypothetical protein
VSYLLPPGVSWVFYLVGQPWPQGDEDNAWHAAVEYRDAAGALRSAVAALDHAGSVVVAAEQSRAGIAFAAFVTQLGQDIRSLATTADQLADQTDRFGSDLQFTKISMTLQLVWLATEIGVAVASAPFTFGLSMLSISAMIAAVRVAWWQILKNLLVSLLYSAGMMVGIDVVVQVGQLLAGTRRAFDGGLIVNSLEMGALGGGLGGMFNLVGEVALRDAVASLTARAISGGLTGLITAASIDAINGYPEDVRSLLLGLLGGTIAGGAGRYSPKLGPIDVPIDLPPAIEPPLLEGPADTPGRLSEQLPDWPGESGWPELAAELVPLPDTARRTLAGIRSALHDELTRQSGLPMRGPGQEIATQTEPAPTGRPVPTTESAPTTAPHDLATATPDGTTTPHTTPAATADLTTTADSAGGVPVTPIDMTIFAPPPLDGEIRVDFTGDSDTMLTGDAMDVLNGAARRIVAPMAEHGALVRVEIAGPDTSVGRLRADELDGLMRSQVRGHQVKQDQATMSGELIVTARHTGSDGDTTVRIAEAGLAPRTWEHLRNTAAVEWRPTRQVPGRYGVRTMEPAPGRHVREVTLPVNLRAHRVSAYQMAVLRTAMQEAVRAEFWGMALPDGIQSHLRLEFTTAPDAVTVYVDEPAPPSTGRTANGLVPAVRRTLDEWWPPRGLPPGRPTEGERWTHDITRRRIAERISLFIGLPVRLEPAEISTEVDTETAAGRRGG